ncbi:Pilus assembly protein, PilO [Planctomycetes bacterium MalM25]|nr:Pilus assembly protein, PilO [Planctomycetes bacterium MalM25]
MQPQQPGLPKLPTGVLYTLAIVCAVVGFALAYTIIHRPLNDWRRGVLRRSDLVRAQLTDGPELRRQHAERKQQLEALLDRVELVNHRIPDEPKEGEFLSDLSRLAEEHGVTIEDFRRGATSTAGTHSMVSVSVKARGGHAGVCRLVDAVSKLPRLAELTELQIESQSDPTAYPVQLTYALYYGMATPSAEAAL